MDRNIATACTAEVPQLKPLNWRIASSHTKVCGRLLHATPVPARTRSNNLTSSAGADKVDSAILGEKEPFFATFVKPSEAKRLVVKRALGRHPQDLSPRFFFASRANAWDLGHRMSPSRLDYGTARRTRPSMLVQLVSCSNHSLSHSQGSWQGRETQTLVMCSQTGWHEMKVQRQGNPLTTPQHYLRAHRVDPNQIFVRGEQSQLGLPEHLGPGLGPTYKQGSPHLTGLNSKLRGKNYQQFEFLSKR